MVSVLQFFIATGIQAQLIQLIASGHIPAPMHDSPIDFQPLLSWLHDNELAHWAEQLPHQLAEGLSTQRYGDLPGWYQALQTLPAVTTRHFYPGDTVTLGQRQELGDEQWQTLKNCFEALIPWRKGPYSLFDLFVDTEWRSDWKWQRIAERIGDLKGRRVLDVGCGNGYHCWRMFEAGAARVIGIDPSPRFVVQFYMIKHFAETAPVDVLPLGIEALPSKLECFDTTFSMGVLYHRRSPMDHLLELRDTLKPGGELVLETLVIDGGLGEVLVPPGRYGKMNNVWFLPSVPTLESWLGKCGFEQIECIDVTPTTVDEQRATEWMKFQSLTDFLDPHNPGKTVEGHPGPVRAALVARKKTG